jgi:hypothetical protein
VHRVRAGDWETLFTLVEHYGRALGTFVERRFRVDRFRSDYAGPCEFEEELPYAAGIVIDALSMPCDEAIRFVRMISARPDWNRCPILARLSDYPYAEEQTVGNLLRFVLPVGSLQKAGVSVWVDGNIDTMAMRARFFELYRTSVRDVEQRLEAFCQAATDQHRRIWEPAQWVVQVHGA